MINGCEVRANFPGDAAAALPRLSDELAKLGYAPKSVSATELEMNFKGKWITTDPAKMKHSLRVAPADGGLTFRFSTGLIASHWTDSDLRWAQERADQVTAAISE